MCTDTILKCHIHNTLKGDKTIESPPPPCFELCHHLNMAKETIKCNNLKVDTIVSYYVFIFCLKYPLSIINRLNWVLNTIVFFQEQICSYKSASAGATCTGYVAIPPRNEIALQQAVASVGPVSVMIDANTKFTHYTSGIYDDPSCSSLTYNHAVLVVGYGNDQGEDFWLVKNR